MQNTIQVDIISVEKLIFSGKSRSVIVPGKLGELGIYPLHTQLITVLEPGLVKVITASQSAEELFFVDGGFLEVQPDKVTILTTEAVPSTDLDVNYIREIKHRIEEDLKRNRYTQEDKGQILLELSSVTRKLDAVNKIQQK